MRHTIICRKFSKGRLPARFNRGRPLRTKVMEGKDGKLWKKWRREHDMVSCPSLASLPEQRSIYYDCLGPTYPSPSVPPASGIRAGGVIPVPVVWSPPVGSGPVTPTCPMHSGYRGLKRWLFGGDHIVSVLCCRRLVVGGICYRWLAIT